jgi:Protein of unknown function (DUF2867)
MAFNWAVAVAENRQMQVHAIQPNADTRPLLAGAQFSDAFRVAVDDTMLDARGAAERMLGYRPRWIAALMALRNHLVTPFGLKTPSPRRQAAADTVGIFPVLSETPVRLVAGFDDSHLDFRVVVDVAGTGADRQVTATTLVKTHNGLGRAYLAIILPFHRIIVRAMLRQMVA